MKSKYSSFLLVVFLLGIFTFFSGCSEDSVTPPITSSNVVAYNNVVLKYSRISRTDSSSYDLYNGIVVADSSLAKDITFIDYQNNFTEFYFRSGALTLEAGFETRFGRVSNDLSQSSWDTLKTLSSLDTLTYFTAEDTYGFGPLKLGELTIKHPAYAFYLKGRYAYGVTTKRIYGLIYVKDFSGDADNVRVTFDVRYNKAGENDFKKP